jgi:hypothetical protein
MFDEIKDGERIDARMLERLADGGVFKARTLYSGKYVKITPVVKPHELTNKSIRYDSNDVAQVERLETRRWTAKFIKAGDAPIDGNTGERFPPGTVLSDGRVVEDKALIARIKEHHMSDFFSYLVGYAIKYYRNNKVITIPQAVTEATKQVELRNDNPRAFLAEKYTVSGDDADRVKTADLYTEYIRWLKSNAIWHDKKSRQDFGKSLQKSGVTKVKSNAEYFVGLVRRFSGNMKPFGYGVSGAERPPSFQQDIEQSGVGGGGPRAT